KEDRIVLGRNPPTLFRAAVSGGHSLWRRYAGTEKRLPRYIIGSETGSSRLLIQPSYVQILFWTLAGKEKMKIMKKSYHRKVMWREFFTNKTIRIMKMYVIIAFMTLGELMATDVLTQNISLDIQDQPLSQAISEIEQMTDYHVFYNSKLVDLSQKITIQIRNASLEEALDHLFANKEIDYLLVKNLIVLFRKGDPDAEKWIKTIVQEDPVQDKSVYTNRVVTLLTRDKITLRPTRPILSGIVTDESGEPLIGVNVLVKGTNQGTSTDFEGRFSLDEVDDQAVLVVSYIGYQTQEIKVGGRTEIEIVLIEDSQTLDEVVVVGYGTQKKSDLTG